MKYWRLLRSPLQFDYGEGIVLWQAKHILDRGKTYRRIDTPPYNVTHYPPLYHLAVRAAAGNGGDWLYAGRVISFVSGICLVLILGATTFFVVPRRSGLLNRLTAGIVAGCSFFLNYSAEWITYARVDLLGLALTFGGLAVLCLGRKKWPWELLAFTLMVAAGFTKHSLFTVPVACLLAQALVDYRRSVAWLAWSLTLALLPLAYFQAVTNGGFLLNLLVYNQNPYSLSYLASQLHIVFSNHLMLLALGLPILAAGAVWLAQRYPVVEDGWRGKLDKSKFRWYVLVLTIHLLLSASWLLGMGKLGAGFYYALPFILTLNFGCGLTCWFILSSWRTLPGVALYPAATAAAVFAMSLGPQAGTLLRSAPPMRLEVSQRQELISILKREQGSVYSEDMLALLQAGRDVVAEPAIITLLAEHKQWDETPFVRSIRDAEWSLILIEHLNIPELYSPAVKAAIETSYHVTGQIGDTKLYRPKGPSR